MNTIHKTFLLLIVTILFFGTLNAQSAWQTVSASGITFEYRTSDGSTHLEGKVSATSTGWVAVGFNPSSVMRDANIIIGYVSGGTANIRDDWGTSNTSHSADTGMGGTSDVELIQGTEEAGITMLHFMIPLNSGDNFDQAMMIDNSYPIILAKGSADNYTGSHNSAGFATISVLPAPVSNDDDVIIPIATDRISSLYPNPANMNTKLGYNLINSSPVEFSIFNSRGQKVSSEYVQAAKGENEITLNLQNLAAGIYILQMKTVTGMQSRKMAIRK